MKRIFSRIICPVWTYLCS